jgi:hypothetical protein
VSPDRFPGGLCFVVDTVDACIGFPLFQVVVLLFRRDDGEPLPKPFQLSSSTTHTYIFVALLRSVPMTRKPSSNPENQLRPSHPPLPSSFVLHPLSVSPVTVRE